MKIETGRLIIRSLQYEDSDILYRIKTDSQVMEFCPDFLDINTTQQDMQKYIREFQRLEEEGDIDTWRCYAIENKETGKVMGVLTFSKQNMLHEYELGWMMLGEYTKKGYASEAAEAFAETFCHTHNIDYLIVVLHHVELRKNADLSSLKREPFMIIISTATAMIIFIFADIGRVLI